jgi:hypothetical protein
MSARNQFAAAISAVGVLIGGYFLWPSTMPSKEPDGWWMLILQNRLIVFGGRLLLAAIAVVIVGAAIYASLSFVHRIRNKQWLNEFWGLKATDKALEPNELIEDIRGLQANIAEQEVLLNEADTALGVALETISEMNAELDERDELLSATRTALAVLQAAAEEPNEKT